MSKRDKFNQYNDPYELAEKRGWVELDDLVNNSEAFCRWAYSKMYAGELSLREA